ARTTTTGGLQPGHQREPSSPCRRWRRLLVRRQPDGEAGAGDSPVGLQVGRRQRAAVHLDDLARDAEPQPGMRAELLARRALAVEAVEHRLELARRYAGTGVADGDAHE